MICRHLFMRYISCFTSFMIRKKMINLELGKIFSMSIRKGEIDKRNIFSDPSLTKNIYVSVLYVQMGWTFSNNFLFNIVIFHWSFPLFPIYNSIKTIKNINKWFFSVEEALIEKRIYQKWHNSIRNKIIPNN